MNPLATNSSEVQVGSSVSPAATVAALSASSLLSSPAASASSLPAISPPVQPATPTVNSVAPPESPRPLTTHYLQSSASFAVPPLLDIPASLLDPNLSADELAKQLLDAQSTHHTLHALRRHTALLHASLVECKRRLDAVTQSRGQSVAYLQREVLSKERTINSLLAERRDMIGDVEAVKDACRDEVREEKARLREDKRRLESELAVVTGGYNGLKDFAHERRALQDDVARLEAALDEEKRAHNRDVCELERRNILEKEKMKNNMLLKIRDTKLTLLAQTEDQLSTITKRTMLENQQVITELMYQSKETEKMNRQYSDMSRREEQYSRESQLWKQERKQLNDRLLLYSKMVKQLQQRERQSEEKEDMQAGQTAVRAARATADSRAR